MTANKTLQDSINSFYRSLQNTGQTQQAQAAQNAAYQSAIQAQQAQQIMAGGSLGVGTVSPNGSLGIGVSNSSWGQGAYSSTSRYNDNERRGIEHRAMLRERQATVDLIKEMAEEVGAPNLLHAIVLAITSREYPTEE